jgi:hypothetical protein
VWTSDEERAGVRVELPHALVAVGRASGLAGLLAAAAGVAAVAAAFQPWHEATAELAMLGAAEDRAVVSLLGWATLPGLAAGVAGVVAAALGLTLAVDRHPGWTRRGLLGAAGVLLVAGAFGQLRRPTLDRFPDESGALADLRAVVDELPRGVELTLSVRPGAGATIVLVAAALLLAAVASARELDAH